MCRQRTFLVAVVSSHWSQSRSARLKRVVQCIQSFKLEHTVKIIEIVLFWFSCWFGCCLRHCGEGGILGVSGIKVVYGVKSGLKGRYTRCGPRQISRTWLVWGLNEGRRRVYERVRSRTLPYPDTTIFRRHFRILIGSHCIGLGRRRLGTHCSSHQCLHFIVCSQINIQYLFIRSYTEFREVKPS